jgi:threonine aldolase
MRQVGILCAAALYALEHHRARLADDHANARRLAIGLAGVDGVRVDADKVETNIVIFEIVFATTGLTAAEVARRTDAAAGVRLHAIAPARLRAVTHLDVDAAGVDRAIAAVRAALANG